MKKREGGMCTYKKLSLLKLVQTDKKIFSKDIMSNLHTKDGHMREFYRGVMLRCSFRKF